MALYCYRCVNDHGFESTQYGLVWCWKCDAPAARDYQAEAVGIGPGVRASRYADGDLVLPTQKDFERPGDPDGTKGIRQWKDTHKPHPTNKSPRWPSGGKRSF